MYQAENLLGSIFKEQSKIIEMISLMNMPLQDTLKELAQTIDLVIPSVRSSIMIFDENTETLGQGIGPQLPEGYLSELEGLKIGSNAGACGTAAFFKKTIIVEDTATDPLWEPFRLISQKYNVDACWSKPLLSPEQALLGTMAFYCWEKRRPTPHEQELIDIFSNLASLIIAKKKTEEILRLSNTVVEKSPVILMRWKAELGWPLEYVTENVSQIGYTAKEFLKGTINFAQIIHPDDIERVTNEVSYYSKQHINQYTQEYRIITKDGSVKWIDDRTIIQRNEQGVITHYQGTILDITERKEAEATIQFLADNDHLTELPNRRSFMDQLEKQLKSAESIGSRVAVFFLDLNNFKDVNDLMGHLFGDELLISVANKLKKKLASNCYVARVSGDEFALIQWDFFHENDVLRTGDHLIQLFNEPFLVEGLEFNIQVSIGISLFPSHGNTPEELLKQADLAMYNAKKLGFNNYQLFTQAMEEAIRWKKQLQKDMESALAANQFELYYQPQIEMSSGGIAGVEALIRWNHPERGLLYPNEFIPLSEENDFIFTLDKWVLEKACEQLFRWKKEGIAPSNISVNVTARQFYNKDLVEYIRFLMEKWEVEKYELTLEITEETLMTNKERAKAVLLELRKLGVVTALDDFGTGYSSLSYLKFLPINKLKIDRSFVIDVTEDPRDGAILESMLTIAFNLNLAVIVEGVETKEQEQFLRSIGCQVAQGYYYSRAISSMEMSSLLQKIK